MVNLECFVARFLVRLLAQVGGEYQSGRKSSACRVVTRRPFTAKGRAVLSAACFGSGNPLPAATPDIARPLEHESEH